MEQEIRDKLNGTISIVDNAYRTKKYGYATYRN